MHCPRCPDTPLRATRLEGDLLAESCAQCEGALVSLLHYRDWAERTAGLWDDDAAPALPVVPVSDAPGALACPKCARLMARYRIGQGVGNALDLCVHCDEAWLDGGEWPLLRALQLSHHLPRIFTEPWQRRVRADTAAQAREARLQQRLRQQLGDADTDKVLALRAWLHSHPQRTGILRLLAQP